MAFEVAAVKPTSAGTKFTPPTFALDAGDSYASTGGRFWADFPLSIYIAFAYKISMASIQGQQLPKWVGSDRFNIQAKAEGNPTKNQMRLMMQALLADRFKLAVPSRPMKRPSSSSRWRSRESWGQTLVRMPMVRRVMCLTPVCFRLVAICTRSRCPAS